MQNAPAEVAGAFSVTAKMHTPEEGLEPPTR